MWRIDSGTWRIEIDSGTWRIEIDSCTWRIEIDSGTWRIETRRSSQNIAMFDQVCQKLKLRINTAQQGMYVLCVIAGSLIDF